MPIIFISSFHPLISRNILGTSVIDRVLAARPECTVVILCPERKRAFFEREYASERVLVLGISMRLLRRDLILRTLALSALRTRALLIKRTAELRGRGAWLSCVLSNRAGHFLVRLLSRVFTPRSPFDALLGEFRPALVFSTDVENEYDVRLMHEAKRQGIPIVGMVRSWDNLTAKGLLRVVPDRLVVHNDIIAREATALHGVARGLVSVVGIPHYDGYAPYRDPGSVRAARAVFLRELGFDPRTEVVLFAPVGDRYVSATYAIDQSIVVLLDSCLPDTSLLFVRLPIADQVAGLRPGRFGRVVIERGGSPLGHVKNTELSRADEKRLALTLAASDVVVTGPSTMCVDAAFFDKPTILIGFDGKDAPSIPYRESVQRLYDYEHFLPVRASGGVVFATSERELCSAVRTALSEPERGKLGRKRLALEQAGEPRGRASERLADVLLEFL